MNPVAWFEIYAQDPERARRFYETVLGITLTELNSPIEGMKMLAFPAGQDKYGRQKNDRPGGGHFSSKR